MREDLKFLNSCLSINSFYADTLTYSLSKLSGIIMDEEIEYTKKVLAAVIFLVIQESLDTLFNRNTFREMKDLEKGVSDLQMLKKYCDRMGVSKIIHSHLADEKEGNLAVVTHIQHEMLNQKICGDLMNDTTVREFFDNNILLAIVANKTKLS